MNSGDYAGIIAGTVVSVITLVVGIRVGRRNRQRPELQFVTDFDQLIGAEDGYLAEGVAVTHDGHPIGGISRTCFAIWNHKGDVISRSDVLAGDPLRITLPKDDRALQVRPLTRSREQIGILAQVAPEDHTMVLINFDFLDADDGAVLEVIHQGEVPARIAGTIRGATIVDKGSADLSTSSLWMLREKSWFRRVFRYHFTEWRSVLRFGTLTGAAAAVPVTLVSQFPRVNPLRNGRIVDPGRFDLSSLKGQADFARKVTEVGRPDFNTAVGSAILIVAGLAAFIIALVTLFGPTRQVIPSRILHEWFMVSEEGQDMSD